VKTSAAPLSAARLRDRFPGGRAVVVLGGPSILCHGFDLGRLRARDLVVFLESRALTPRFLEYGVEPDFLIALYPEKCKANALQGVCVQAMFAGIDLRPLLRDEYVPEVDRVRTLFDAYFEPWKPDVPHKRFRWKPDVFFDGSPFDLLRRLERTACLAFREPYDRYVRQQELAQDVYVYDMEPRTGPFDGRAYYDVLVDGDRAVVRDFQFTNSAAIALFPLLRFMGFSSVTLIGMDMSMMGSMEYASLYTFRSLAHFRTFFERARVVFSASYPRRFWSELARQVSMRGLPGLFAPAAWRPLTDRRPWFIRPYYEFDSLEAVLAGAGMSFVNVYEPWEFARPVPGVKNVRFKDFLRTA
jgi:hypothetical protein